MIELVWLSQAVHGEQGLDSQNPRLLQLSHSVCVKFDPIFGRPKLRT